jgi:hypothetical protein
MRAWVFTTTAVAALLLGVDPYLFIARTEAMAPVGLSRLLFAVLFQAAGVIGVAAITLAPKAPLRRFLDETHRALPWAMAVGGIVFGIGLAVGALHYSNCARWDFNRGAMCLM